MKKKLSEKQVNKIYHFTDKSNIESIANCDGLLCLKKIEEMDMSNIQFGGNQWSHDADKIKGLDEYVHLAFLPKHPMAYVAVKDGRINNICWLEISLEVLDLDGVRFCRDVSNKSGVELLANDDALNNIDVEGLYDWLDFNVEGNMARKSNAEKSEVLIPNCIPSAYILNLNSFL